MQYSTPPQPWTVPHLRNRPCQYHFTGYWHIIYSSPRLSKSLNVNQVLGNLLTSQPLLPDDAAIFIFLKQKTNIFCGESWYRIPLYNLDASNGKVAKTLFFINLAENTDFFKKVYSPPRPRVLIFYFTVLTVRSATPRTAQ